MTTTISQVIERLRRTWLEPPDYQPAATLLNVSISSTAETMELAEFLIPEDERLVATGSLLEMNSELVRVTAYDTATRVATVVRGAYDTTEAAHEFGTFVRLAPTWPRISIFEAIADNIITLSPQLFTTSQTQIHTVASNVAPLSDDLALWAISVWREGAWDANDLGGKIVDFHPATGGRAVVLNELGQGSFWVRYARRMASATSEDNTLEDLGVDPRWVNIIMAGAAADLYVGRDLPASSTEWVGAALQAENIPVGTRFQIAAGLSSYRDDLLEKASDEMTIEYRPRIRRRGTFE